MSFCDAPTTRGSACRRTAGWGTDHPGEGRCRDHDETAIVEAEVVSVDGPAHLRPKTRQWYDRVLSEFVLEPHHKKLLQLAAEAWDRGQGAREELDAKGTTYTDRFGQPKARPEVAIERDSRISFARLLRELNLDVDAPDESRPPRLYK